MAQNLVEKIAQRFAVDLATDHTVQSGDFLFVRPAHVMTHDNSAAVIPKFKSMGATKVFSPKQPVFALDHDIQNKSRANLDKYAAIEAFATQQKISFFPAGRGIGHQIMLEEGFALPSTMVVGSDSHSNIYGALSALGTPVVRTDAAAIWATGQTWWQVPEVVQVQFTGKPQTNVSGKDIILSLIGTFNNDEVLNYCLEFTGDGIAALTMDERMAIANMTTEWGALAGLFPYDDITRNFLTSRLSQKQLTGIENNLLIADPDAAYAKEVHIDLTAIQPVVAGPNEVKRATPLPEITKQQIKINKAYLLSCVNGRLEDFAAAAAVLENKTVAAGVTLYIAAASSEVEAKAVELGYWQTLLDAGAKALTAGCGPCIGLGTGLLEDNEVAVSATNRNFKGRMGSAKAQVYLASPAVVAASAVAGFICGPGVEPGAEKEKSTTSIGTVNVQHTSATSTAAVTILPGFPQAVTGELLFVPKDNMNTDGIYGKEFTYQENLSPDEMGSKAMLNYDPDFQKKVQQSDILVGGYNFGSGSSREQAATALKFRGVQLIIAASFSQTYKRNAFNNGYMVVECPELVEAMKTAFAKQSDKTIRTGWQTKIDFSKATITCQNNTYSFAPLGDVAQKLVIKGGFEPLIREQLAAMNRP